MSDDKEKTRAKLLNELESIKTLLRDDELQDLEPPILTSAIEGIDDAPLLTEILDEDIPPTDEAIPILDEAIELPVEPEIVPDIVPEKTTAVPAATEQQQSLFEPEMELEPANPPPPAAKPQPAPAKPDTATLSSGRGENPFLPKHIRERIEANRKQQSAMMEALAPSAPASAKPAEPEAKAPTPGKGSAAARPNKAVLDHEKLIDEMVERFLPSIEAALRERLQALLREQDTAQEDGDS